MCRLAEGRSAPWCAGPAFPWSGAHLCRHCMPTGGRAFPPESPRPPSRCAGAHCRHCGSTALPWTVCCCRPDCWRLPQPPGARNRNGAWQRRGPDNGRPCHRLPLHSPSSQSYILSSTAHQAHNAASVRPCGPTIRSRQSACCKVSPPSRYRPAGCPRADGGHERRVACR